MTKYMRWNQTKEEHEESPQKVDQFLNEIFEVMKRHGLSISHDDDNGAFIIKPFNNVDKVWLEHAMIKDM